MWGVTGEDFRENWQCHYCTVLRKDHHHNYCRIIGLSGLLRSRELSNSWANQISIPVVHPYLLTHWGRVTKICVGNLTIIVSDDGLSPGRRQAIIWTNAGTLLIRSLGTNLSEILMEIHTFSFNKMHWKMPSAKWRPCSLGLNVLTHLWLAPGTCHCNFLYVIFKLLSWTEIAHRWMPQNLIDN